MKCFDLAVQVSSFLYHCYTVQAVEVLRGGGNAVDAVCTATQVLEDSPRTNAGFGSSLTAEGKCGVRQGT